MSLSFLVSFFLSPHKLVCDSLLELLEAEIICKQCSISFDHIIPIRCTLLYLTLYTIIIPLKYVFFFANIMENGAFALPFSIFSKVFKT